ncbi:hypothetical protein MAM1_0069d04089 [Mucor ambiguus]|uniref:Uncharacterized protein n=1 Tax=Mucor ambiguus TaxID=91626 RepID=A0A0C9MRF6_9FUNG|nr:hypothetical protein MAM1_0069d04089 [Mucor ambiguus]
MVAIETTIKVIGHANILLDIATNDSFKDKNEGDTVDSNANDNSTANAVEATTVIISGHAEQEATDDIALPPTAKYRHNRTNHWNCARNPSNLNNVHIARNPDFPEVARHSIGAMGAVGSTCGTSTRRSIASPIKTVPIYHRESTDKEQRNRQRVKQGIRSYNSALSSTSMNVDLDKRYANEKHGAYAFRIHASAHHLMSPELIPNPNNAI